MRGRKARSGSGSIQTACSRGPPKAARTSKGGIWYTREGKYVEDPDKARAEACEYLGKQLCPLGKADEDLLSVTVMGLINKTAPSKEEPKPEEPKGASEKSQ
ncbi:MAG: hypothetical protein JRJ80_21135 [Deltaproteobacteria bacterium]|nr:hypothetical protein [Deltaproteobacteria bacterium]